MPNITDIILRLNPFVPQCNGMTVWTPWRTYVLIGSWLHGEEREYVEAHEKVHCRQIARDGICKFAWIYTWDYVRYGYRNVRYEKEARALENL